MEIHRKRGNDIVISLPEELAEEANEMAKSKGHGDVKDMLVSVLKRQMVVYRNSKLQQGYDDLNQIK